MKEDLNQIKRRIEALTGLDDLAASGRKKEYVIARAIYFDMALKLRIYSPDEVAKFIGRDRTTLLYSREKLEGYLKSDAKMKVIYDQLNDKSITGEDKVLNLEKQVFDLKQELSNRSKVTVPKTHLSLIELINRIPDHHVDLVKMRLEPIIVMLPKTYDRNG